MAKRFNIIRNIKEEIKKGNVYVTPNGNFVSADLLNKKILTQFKHELSSGNFDYSKSLEDYKKEKLEGYTTAAEVLDGICEAFNIINDDAASAEEAPDGQEAPELPKPETSEPSSDSSETVSSDSEPEKPKRRKKKDGDAK